MRPAKGRTVSTLLPIFAGESDRRVRRAAFTRRPVPQSVRATRYKHLFVQDVPYLSGKGIRE
jgi:hypothetical protein